MDFFYPFFSQITFKDIIDILIVAVLLYQFFLIIQGTRAVQMMFGLAVLGVLFGIGIMYKLYSINWILSHFLESFFIIAVILFQDQIRNALASFGSGRQVFAGLGKDESIVEINELVESASAMSRERVGALIVLERTNGLMNYISSGTRMDSKIHSDLIYAIFDSSSAIHDGAVIISSGVIAAAGCFLPLSKNMEIDRHMGTRHRAGLGISEVSDAIVVVVSEETGKISICYKSNLYPIASEKYLRQYLKHLWSYGNLDEMVIAGVGQL